MRSILRGQARGQVVNEEALVEGLESGKGESSRALSWMVRLAS